MANEKQYPQFVLYYPWIKVAHKSRKGIVYLQNVQAKEPEVHPFISRKTEKRN
jgi:hypothetical protein